MADHGRGRRRGSGESTGEWLAASRPISSEVDSTDPWPRPYDAVVRCDGTRGSPPSREEPGRRRPCRGRTPARGAEQVALLRHGAPGPAAFGSRSDVVRTVIALDDTPHTVVGRPRPEDFAALDGYVNLMANVL